MIHHLPHFIELLPLFQLGLFLAPLVPYIMGASAVVGAGSAIAAADEGRRQAHFQADQAVEASHEATIQGNIAATNAAQTEADANKNYDAAMVQRRRVLGSNETAVAASGLTMGGSATDVYNDTALTFTQQANRELASTLNEAGNYRSQSSTDMISSRNLLITADNYNRSAKAATTNGYLTAAGRLMSGFAGAASSAQALEGSKLLSQSKSRLPPRQ